MSRISAPRRARWFALAASAGVTVLVSGAAAYSAPSSQAQAAPSSQVVVGSVSEEGQPSIAKCPDGTRVAGGGHVSASWYHANGGDMHDATLVSVPLSDGSGWAAQQLKGKVQARAMCTPEADAPEVTTGPVGKDGTDSSAICSSGTHVVGGGYASRNFHYAKGGNIYDMVITSAPRASGDGWFARQFKGDVQARALCAKD